MHPASAPLHYNRAVNTLRDVTVITSAGAAEVAFFGRPVLRAWRARSWPKVQGTVVATNIAERRVRSGGSNRTEYVLSVEYAYPAPGGERRGSHFSFFAPGAGYRTQGAAASARKAYATGGPIDLRVGPTDAGEAVLNTAIPWFWAVATAFFSLFLVAGVSGLVRILLA